MFNPTPNTSPDTLSAAQRGVLEVANCVAFDVLATLTGTNALRGLAGAARVLTGASYAAIGVARPGAALWSEFVAAFATPELEAQLTPLLQPHQRLEPDGEPISSFLSVPIRRGESVLGALVLCNKAGDDFSDADEIIMRALCAHAAVAVFHLEMVDAQRALVRGLMLAQEEERRAVAYDLHDGLTQYVMAAHAHLQGFQAAQKTERAAGDLEQGFKLLQEAVIESRRLVNGLRLLALDDLGLAGALEQLLGEERARAGWSDATFTHNLIGRRFDETLETAIYRVAQEALTNARRHAKATQVRVVLLEEAASGDSTFDARLRLEVRDWGCGFDPARNFGPGHFGLHGVLERVHILEGDYQLHSAPGQGTTLCATLPATLPASASASAPASGASASASDAGATP